MENMRICDILTEYVKECDFRMILKEAEDEIIYDTAWRDRME